jgi:arabinogalactan endo-1,4-beta-galactosidase
MPNEIRAKRQNQTSHRAHLCAWILAVIAPLLSAGCAGREATAASIAKPPPFYLGADISTLSEVERRGGVYMDGDKPGDALAIFMKNGWTCFRLRIWVDPRNGLNGLEYTTKLAKRIKDAGATFMLDFHYSDWWADPQKQNKPAAWAKLDFDALAQQTESYTASVMRTLKQAGATPDFVQIGNEITGGLLWPDAQVQVPLSTVKVFSGDVAVITPPQPYDDAQQWNHLIRILKAASQGVRSATTAEDHVRIVVHIDCGGDWPVTQWYFDHLTRAGVDFDVIGQSFYPNWHGTMENLRDNLRETIDRYHKDVMVVETAYPSRDVHPAPAAARNMIWPMTPEGQKQFLADLIKTVREAPEGRGIGVNYWHPEATYVPGAAGGRGGRPDANSLFDAKGRPMPAMNVLGLQPAAATTTINP